MNYLRVLFSDSLNEEVEEIESDEGDDGLFETQPIPASSGCVWCQMLGEHDCPLHVRPGPRKIERGEGYFKVVYNHGVWEGTTYLFDDGGWTTVSSSLYDDCDPVSDIED